MSKEIRLILINCLIFTYILHNINLYAHIIIMSYDFHAKAKQLIKSGHLVSFETIKKHYKNEPALVMYFDNHSPISVSKEKWAEYGEIIMTVTDIF